MSKQLAIIKKVSCGVGDRGRAWLQFVVYISESISSMQIIEWDDAKEVIEAYGVEDVHQLNGKPCWVEQSEDHSLIKWIGPAKI